jgi:signal transduction histidine kinase
MHITNELLTLASVGKQEVLKTKLDMAAILNETKARMFSIIMESGAKITAPKYWPEVLGYAGWVEEIWANYLSNAIKYGGKPPVIVVGYDQPKDGFIRFWVQDNGDGILIENQLLIFNQFTRLSPALGQGHGLGLSIVKRITDELGGVCGVESTAIEGQGSLFYFTLPIA